MLRITLDQMRSSAGRLAAAGIAIVLGTAFVAASLLATATMERAAQDAFTASYGDADLVVSPQGDPLSRSAVDDVRSTPGVRAADLQAYFGVQMTGGGATEFVPVGPTASDPRLRTSELAEGTEATAPDEVVLSAGVADRLGLTVGDTVEATWQGYTSDPPETFSARLTVVGLLEETSNFFSRSVGALVSADQLEQWQQQTEGSDDFYGAIVIALDDGADVETVRSALRADTALTGATVQTVPEIADEMTAQQTGSTSTFLAVTLAFASVALAVAGLVISNTFQVLVAQRTRTLALLRCVGAGRGQIRRSVLTEAAIVGLLASVTGFALGTGIVVVGLRVLAQAFPAAALGTTVPVSPVVPIVSIGVGLAVTVLAAFVPARMATRVAPVAALRPIEGAVESSGGTARRRVTVVALVLGGAMLAGGVALALGLSGTDQADAGVLGGLALGIVGGLISVCGLLVGSVFLVPRVLPLLGRLAGRSVPARLATANAVRNPRRTSATTNALVIGVALVVMMSTGAVSARESLLSALDSTFPIDVVASTADPSSPITPAQIQAVDEVDGIAASATVSSTSDVEISDGTNTLYPSVTAFGSGDPSQVLRAPGVLDGLVDDTIVLDEDITFGSFSDGDTVTVTGTGGETRELRVVTAPITGTLAYVTPATLEQVAPDVPVNGVWARIADGADSVAVANGVQTTVNDLTTSDTEGSVLSVSGAALERAAFGQIIDTMLSVVIGLLAVAVVIALVGVANTLSLSVLERRRESATLRAMGLTRRQLRGMLAVEGVLIAAVGALIGGVAGILYGWAGAAIVLGGFGEPQLAVPWVQLGAVAAVALVAGLLASVLPARSAVRQSPVAALATD